MASPTIFLDIDGVICCNMNGHLEEPKLQQLRRIVEATGAKVVLSTDWRRQAPLKKQLHVTLERLGIECIGATPMRAMFQPIRPQEITAWLQKSGSRVSTWVAIDDRDLLHEMGGAALQGHMVRTHPATGLTSTLADRAIRILQRDQPPSSACSDGTASEMTSSLRSLSLASGPARGREGPETPPPVAVGCTPPWATDTPQTRGRPVGGSCSSAAYGAVSPSRSVGGGFGGGGLVGMPAARPLTVNGGGVVQPPAAAKTPERSIFSATAPPRYSSGARLSPAGQAVGPTTRARTQQAAAGKASHHVSAAASPATRWRMSDMEGSPQRRR